MNKQNDGFGVVCVVQCDGVGVVQMGAPARFTGRSSGGCELCGGDCRNLDFVAPQYCHEQLRGHALGRFVVVGRVVANGVCGDGASRVACWHGARRCGAAFVFVFAFDCGSDFFGRTDYGTQSRGFGLGFGGRNRFGVAATGANQ